MDTLSPIQRSRVMSLIKQRDTKLEKQFRIALWATGVRYRKNVRMYGTPDIVIRKVRLLIFLDSCFWHGCRHHCRMPKSNVEFWSKKIGKNRERDRAVTRFYRAGGWTVLRFWEHSLAKNFDGCLAKVLTCTSQGLASEDKTSTALG
jgi:DNA mismatch endonuclease (patch repair protein)